MEEILLVFDTQSFPDLVKLLVDSHCQTKIFDEDLAFRYNNLVKFNLFDEKF